MSRSVLVSAVSTEFTAPVILSKRELPSLIEEGTRYGLLTALKEFELRKRPDGRNRCYQKFVCDCGNALFLVGYSVKNGNTRSCGCVHTTGVKTRMTTHGLSKTREYRNELSVRVRGKRRALIKNSTAEKVSKSDLENLFNEYGRACWICEHPLNKVVWDHYHPIAKGGSHSKKNLRPSCNPCNIRKNALWPFTDEMKEKIANDVRALRTPQEHTIPAKDGKEVPDVCHS